MVTETAETTLHPKLRSLSADPREDKHKILIYGKSGVGKTRFAADLACYFRVFLLTSEKKRTSIRSSPNFRRIEPNLKYWEASSWDEVQEGMLFLSDNYRNFDWAVIDSVTDINKRIREEVNKKSKDEVLSKLDWNKISSRMERFIRFTRDIPINVLFIALSTETRNDLTGQVTQYPSVTGGLKEEMPGYMETIGYAYTAESKTEAGSYDRWISFQASPAAVCKDEFDVLTVEPLNMDQFLLKTGLMPEGK